MLQKFGNCWEYSMFCSFRCGEARYPSSWALEKKGCTINGRSKKWRQKTLQFRFLMFDFFFLFSSLVYLFGLAEQQWLVSPFWEPTAVPFLLHPLPSPPLLPVNRNLLPACYEANCLLWCFSESNRLSYLETASNCWDGNAMNFLQLIKRGWECGQEPAVTQLCPWHGVLIGKLTPLFTTPVPMTTAGFPSLLVMPMYFGCNRSHHFIALKAVQSWANMQPK